MLKTTDRIELELQVREAAIQIASKYGEEGAIFFHSEFLAIAKEYVEGQKLNEQNNAILPFRLAK